MNFKKYQSFFKNKKVIITGGTGFVGSFAVNILSKLAAETYVIVRESSDLTRISGVMKNIQICEVALEEPGSLQNFFQSNSIDFIFHFAQPPHSDLNSVFNYPSVQQSSLKMLTNVLEFARLKGDIKIISACSSSTYGNGLPNNDGAFNEETEKNPKSLRGLVKLSERNLCQYYAKNFNLPVFIGRIFRAYGPDDSKNKLIDKSLINYRNNQPIRLVNESIKRDYIYVDDIVDCLLKMCVVTMNAGEEINIGSGIERTASDIIDSLNEILDGDIIISDDFYPLSEMDQTSWKADISKANRLLKWKPQTSLKEGLEKCVLFHNLNKQP